MQTGFAITAFLALILNLLLPEEIEDEETPELTADTVEEEKDEAEWNKIRRSVDARAMSHATGMGGEVAHLPKIEESNGDMPKDLKVTKED